MKQFKPMKDGTYIENRGQGWEIFSWDNGMRKHLGACFELSLARRFCEAHDLAPTMIQSLADKLEVMV